MFTNHLLTHFYHPRISVNSLKETNLFNLMLIPLWGSSRLEGVLPWSVWTSGSHQEMFPSIPLSLDGSNLQHDGAGHQSRPGTARTRTVPVQTSIPSLRTHLQPETKCLQNVPTLQRAPIPPSINKKVPHYKCSIVEQILQHYNFQQEVKKLL